MSVHTVSDPFFTTVGSKEEAVPPSAFAAQPPARVARVSTAAAVRKACCRRGRGEFDMSVRIRCEGLSEPLQGEFGDPHQRLLARLAVAGVDADDGYVGRQGERAGHL